MMEILTPEMRPIISTISQLLYVAVFTITIAVLRYVTKNINYLIAFGATIGLISSVCIHYFLEESPLFLLKKNRHLEAFQVLEKIFVINKKASPREIA